MQLKIRPEQHGASGIYRIINEISGNVYIGSTKAFLARWRDHRSALRNGRHENNHLQKAFNKYGTGAFVIEVVTECAVDELLVTEQRYLDAYYGERCYNISITAGCPRGYKHTAEAKLKISLAAKGRIYTPQQRANMSAAQKKVPHGPARPETVAKRVAKMMGHLVSAETRVKISAANKLRWAERKANQ